MKKWYAGVAALAIVVVGAFVFHGRLGADFWPLDSSRVGPNLVASVVQWAIIALVVYVAYPPFRKAMEQIAHKANAELHEKLDRNFAAAQHIAKHHPDIPEIGHDGHTKKEQE